MKCTRLPDKFLEQRTHESRTLYNRQRNICVSLLMKSKRAYLSKLDDKVSRYDRKFWKSDNLLSS